MPFERLKWSKSPQASVFSYITILSFIVLFTAIGQGDYLRIKKNDYASQ